MRIFIDLIPVRNDLLEGSTGLIVTALRRIALEHTGNEWFILSQNRDEQDGLFMRNTRHLRIRKTWPGYAGWKIMYERQIPRLIKKHHADLYISPAGIACASPVAQMICIPGDGEANRVMAAGYLSFFKKNLDKSAERSKTIFAFSAESKSEIITRRQTADNKIEIIYAAPGDAVYALSWTEKESIKIKYTAGKEYFIVTGSPGSAKLLEVLKAFSQFKKRQQSNMQLVIAVKDILSDGDFADKLDSYKYRTDVHTPRIMTEDEKQKMISAAYAMVYCAENGDPGAAVFDAFKAHVPVIAETGSFPVEIGDGTVLYVERSNSNSMAEGLMLLYKDEKIRNDHIEKGQQQVACFSWEKTVGTIWNAILQAANK